MFVVVAFAVGLLFGAGLVLSGMMNPAKVLGFLDVAGHWDPSLAFVMGGAVTVGLGAFALARRRTQSLLGTPMQLATPGPIDARLVAGSIVFRIGWGLAGLCPGPALVAAGAGYAKAAVFVLAMVAGMLAFEAAEGTRRGGDTPTKRGETA
ncbi:MAG: DUF6691 family protein [Burkholderiales bacterium]